VKTALGQGLSRMQGTQPLGNSNEWIQWLWLLLAFVCWQGRALSTVFLKEIVEPIFHSDSSSVFPSIVWNGVCAIFAFLCP